MENLIADSVSDGHHYLPADRVNWPDVRSVTVIQNKNLGDAVLLLPVIGKLRELLPSVTIQIITHLTNVPIFQGFENLTFHKYARSLAGTAGLFRDLRGQEVVLDFQPSVRHRALARLCHVPVRSGLAGGVALSRHDTHPVPWRASVLRHQAELNLDVLRRLGVRIDPRDRLVRFPEVLPQIPSQTQPRDYVVLHPGSRWMFKSPTIDYWQSLTRKLVNELQMPIYVTGGNSEMEKRLALSLESVNGVVNLCGQTSIVELMGLIRDASAFVGVDTFAAHLAVGFDQPGVVIFGPSDPHRWGPRSFDRLSMVRASMEDYPCMPCNTDGCGGGTSSDCLMGVSVDRVVCELLKSMGKSGC